MTLTVQCSGCKEYIGLIRPVSQAIVCSNCGRGLRVRFRQEKAHYVVTLAPLEPPTEDDQAKSSGALKADWTREHAAAIRRREAKPTNASQRELAKGHPVSWPSNEGEEP